jgi:hypothetical protein
MVELRARESVESDSKKYGKHDPASAFRSWHGLLFGAAIGTMISCGSAENTNTSSKNNNPVIDSGVSDTKNSGGSGGSVNDADIEKAIDAGGAAGNKKDSSAGTDGETVKDAGHETYLDAEGGNSLDVEASVNCDPLTITNIIVDISPFGNETTISWSTNEPTSCDLVWNTTGDPTGQAFGTDTDTGHSITFGDYQFNKMAPGNSYDFFIGCGENCQGQYLHVETEGTFQTKKPHLLIVLSPRYSENIGIDSAIQTYSQAIAVENWVTDIVKLNPTINDHSFVKAILADRKHNNNTPAAILVGLDLPFDFYNNFYVCPRLKDWIEIDHISGPCDGFQNMDIAISILPVSPGDDNLPYVDSADKVSQAFLKFASDRNGVGSNNVTVFYDNDAFKEYHFDPPDYPELKMLGDLTIKSGVTSDEIQALQNQSLKLLMVSAHGTSDDVFLNPSQFNAYDFDTIGVPLGVVGGCHTYCWIDSYSGDVHPYPSDHSFFGNQVLGTTSQRAIVAGIPTKGVGQYQSSNFVFFAIPQLAKGRSLAQAVYGWHPLHCGADETYDVAIYGDITFHY